MPTGSWITVSQLQALTAVIIVSGGVTLGAPGMAGPKGDRSLPSWYTSATTNEWTTLPRSTFTSSGVGWTGIGMGKGPYTKVVEAWNGGVLNTVGVYYGGSFIPGTFLVLFGGGHTDWYGNELYAYGPIESDAAIWRRLSDPTSPPALNAGRTAAGYPVSRHTYDTIQYDPVANQLVTFAAPAAANAGNGIMTSDLFNFNVDPYAVKAWTANDSGMPSGGSLGPTLTVSGWNPSTRQMWAMPDGNTTYMAKWDGATGIWTAYAMDNPSGAYNGKAAIHPTANLLVYISRNGPVIVQNLNTPAVASYQPTVTGTGPTKLAGSMLDWDAAGARFVAWDQTGKTVYFLTPGANPMAGGDAWAWSSATPAGGSTPANAHVQGTYGRFRVVNGTMRGILLMSHYNSPIYFYKFCPWPTQGLRGTQPKATLDPGHGLAPAHGAGNSG